ncbi:DNA topoisomerase I, mitochondrial [Vicugna pacos]|uniref:DNA topoisomerase I, mitochondrial n=1 Tax=Vicugna pacos TaxID=30538 RepID=A0ABM5CBJ0_VICPA
MKWMQLEHRGPCFASPSEPLPAGVRFYYSGKPVKLSLAAEVTTFYGKMLDHECTAKEVFQNNFFSGWRKGLKNTQAPGRSPTARSRGWRRGRRTSRTPPSTSC